VVFKSSYSETGHGLAARRIPEITLIECERKELFTSCELLQPVLGLVGHTDVLARDHPGKLERKVSPDESASCSSSVRLEAPLQVIRRSNINVVVPAPQGVYTPSRMILFQCSILMGCT
jgi:hypothetical protein